MRIYQVADKKELGKKAAAFLAEKIKEKPDALLGLATGSTPIETYEELANLYQKGELDFSKIKTVNLDEYRGISRKNEQSYYYFMEKNLFSKVNIDLENTYIPDGSNPDAETVCREYEEKIQELGPIEVQLLGLGHDGHIAFNEPDKIFPDMTHCADLNERTIQANKRFFEREEDVPRQAYTMGIGTIMRAKSILLLVSGEEKADILKAVLQGDVTPEIPATILKFHPNVTVIGDQAALSKL